ncbi:hypothetical protein D7V97_12985 [Corallococcus sp. CA053C]|uniref:hypothetical protein n=1 Tax=Corallococcus sp. CA053C TaxID=2316732 RepID=UPI000EA2DC20|nr:hypothetical protein [Corallococcus sp. CA053C]RKH10774.1 hypothetical protein D7V97_12985 [Corallococcus sp. CA053C]
MSFPETLKVELTLTAGDQTVTVAAGSLKALSVKAHGWGFEADVEWWVLCREKGDEDTFFAAFTGAKPLTATFTLTRLHGAKAEGRDGPETPPLKFVGRVEARQVHERALPDLKDAPVLQRRYRVRVADAASVLWRRHFPCGVWVDSSLQEVIQANTPGGLALEFKWEAAAKKQPLHALGLGVDDTGASFHDFLHWLQARWNAGLFFAPDTGKYTLTDQKPEGGEALPLDLGEVEAVDLHYPEPRRDTLSVLNSYVEAGTPRKDVDNTDAVEGVRREYLLTSTLESALTERVTRETLLQRPEGPEVRVAFKSFPRGALVLNGLYTFGAGWSTTLATHGGTYRLHGLTLEAKALEQDPAHDPDGKDNLYQVTLEAVLEEAADPTFRRPAFTRPCWPFFAEGTVVSDVGDEKARTYQARQDEETSQETYRVQLPLWDKEVRVPYEPHQQPGHFYFPADKGTRLLVALGFQDARLERFLAWRPGARLPKETQGNHLLLGKAPESETSIQHIYEDEKPLLRIQRTREKDTQLIEVAEGRMLLRIKEEG